MYIKKIVFIVFFITSIVFILTDLLNAESIFLKNGSIVEGVIIKESIEHITIKMANNKIIEVSRNNIIRTVFNNDYKNLMYIYKNDGTTIEGYIVYETRDSYTIRKKLNSSQEFWVLKKDVSGTSATKMRSTDFKPYSTVGAIFGSCIPLWSGSFLMGGDKFGFLFILGKTSTLIGAIALTASYHPPKNQTSSNYNGDTKFMLITVLYALYISCTIGDMVYSGIKIHRYNNSHIYGSAYRQEDLFSISISPRISFQKNKKEFQYNTDGFNIAVMQKF